MKILRKLIETAFDYIALPSAASLLELPVVPARLLADRTPETFVGPVPSADMLLIDISFSMGCSDYPPSRLSGAVTASKHFLQKLAATEPEAAAGIAVFCGSAVVVHPPVRVLKKLPSLETSLDLLDPRSATNIGGGLLVAQQALVGVPTQGRRRIVLLTDGASNTGPAPGPIATHLKRAGVQLDIIGIGGSPAEVDEPLLRSMASMVSGKPRYWFIKSVGELVERFETLALREVDSAC